jgi:hypothetical protein
MRLRKSVMAAVTGTLVAFAVVSLAGPAAARHRHHKHHHPDRVKTLLAFQTMYGVDGPFVGEENPVRGVIGDELPWEIEAVDGKLETNGHLHLEVRGLVFADEPGVPPDIIGTNDEDQFRALVSCLTEKGDKVVEANVVTRGFPATPQGDSVIDAHLQLPNPCVAPIVMVLAGSEDKWFAMTGFERD